ncbi:MAG: heavy-metal-associated domain-containing protein [Planctomycetes bacterium]|nr:heavy-metal-associated domain-containing protein [Planctomycetota bacterium]
MKNVIRLAAVVAAGLILGGWNVAVATDPVPTKITVPDMDCASCAKKVGNKVAEVKGVGKVEYSVEGRYISVTPKAGEAISPKSLWEAVENAKLAPSKLEGPAGVFTKKPAQ